MKADHLSLLHSLFTIINENEVHDTSHVLAQYFLDHYQELNLVNIYEVAESCYVSRASVRRFCKSLGYDNFADMKSEFSLYDIHYESYLTFAQKENHRQLLTSSINNMIAELDKRMDTREVYNIAKRMKQSERVIFLASGPPAGVIREFQQAMLFNRKIINLVTDLRADNPLLQHSNENDYIITISNTGTFAHASYPLIADSLAYKSLITLNRDPFFNKWYDVVYHLSAKDRSNEGENVYNKYGITYMMDIIYSEYTKNFT